MLTDAGALRDEIDQRLEGLKVLQLFGLEVFDTPSPHGLCALEISRLAPYANHEDLGIGEP